MNRFEFKLPDIGEGIAEAELVNWLVDVGEDVEEEQPVVEVMTDKATVELESPVSGRIIERTGEIGDLIRVGSALLAIETSGEASPGDQDDTEAAPRSGNPSREPGLDSVESGKADAPKTPSGKVLATPLVRRRAKELGIDLSSVSHEGRRVKNADLDAFLSVPRQQDEPDGQRQDKNIPIIGMRRAIARRMEEATRSIPHFTYVDEIDMTEIERLREFINSKNGEIRITPLPLMIKAICLTISEFPQFNAHYFFDQDLLRQFSRVHFGVAVQTDGGLLVPVVREADRMTVSELASAIAARSRECREGTIAAKDLKGSTTTISSLGNLGGIVSTPVINAPEVCIIAPNRIVERPVWTSAGPAPRKMMNISISCDHRIIDGYDAAKFTQALKQRLEIPALIFADDI